LIDLLAVRTGRKLIACRERTNEVEQTVRRFARRLSFIGPAGGGSARRCANRLGYRLLNRSRDGGRPIAIEAAVAAGPKSARRRPSCRAMIRIDRQQDQAAPDEVGCLLGDHHDCGIDVSSHEVRHY